MGSIGLQGYTLNLSDRTLLYGAENYLSGDNNSHVADIVLSTSKAFHTFSPNPESLQTLLITRPLGSMDRTGPTSNSGLVILLLKIPETTAIVTFLDW